MKTIKTLSVILACVFSLNTATADEGQENVVTLRDHTALDTQKPTAKIPKVNNSDIKQTRSYPMQPPVIPHQVRNYQVDLKVNKCMSCHSRQRSEDSQAPMVSVTHYMDREGNFLAEISPRRYFCSQCHVPQLLTEELVENTFEDMHSMMKNKGNNEE